MLASSFEHKILCYNTTSTANVRMKYKPDIYIISGKSPIGDSGGYPAYAHNLSRVLTSLGYSVNIFAISDTSSIRKTQYGTIYFLGTRLIRLFPILRHVALAGLPYYSILFYKSMKKVLQRSKNKSCIIWGMGPWGFPGMLVKLFPPRLTSVLLYTSYFTSTLHEMHGAYRAIKIQDYGVWTKLKYFIVYYVVAPIFHILEQFTLWNCDRIIVHYRSSQRIIQKYFFLPPKHRIVRFPWHVDIFLREGPGAKSQTSFPHPLIISICRQDPRKGLNFLIRAMEEVIAVSPNAHCLIVGTGELLELNKKLVTKLHLEKSVSVVGFVPDIRSILKEADIVVIVPLAQGSSALTVLEAMSFGKAIIGSRCDGIPEDITHQRSCLIIPPGDSNAIAEAILRIINDPKLRKRLGAGAYATYQKRFGLQKMRLNFSKVISQSLSYAH